LDLELARVIELLVQSFSARVIFVIVCELLPLGCVNDTGAPSINELQEIPLAAVQNFDQLGLLLQIVQREPRILNHNVLIVDYAWVLKVVCFNVSVPLFHPLPADLVGEVELCHRWRHQVFKQRFL